MELQSPHLLLLQDIMDWRHQLCDQTKLKCNPLLPRLVTVGESLFFSERYHLLNSKTKLLKPSQVGLRNEMKPCVERRGYRLVRGARSCQLSLNALATMEVGA